MEVSTIPLGSASEASSTFFSSLNSYKQKKTQNSDYIVVHFPSWKERTTEISATKIFYLLTEALGRSFIINYTYHSSNSVRYAIEPNPEIYFLLRNLKEFKYLEDTYHISYLFGKDGYTRFFIQGISEEFTDEFLYNFFSFFGKIKYGQKILLALNGKLVSTNFYYLEFEDTPNSLPHFNRIKLPRYNINWIVRWCINYYGSKISFMTEEFFIPAMDIEDFIQEKPLEEIKKNKKRKYKEIILPTDSTDDNFISPYNDIAPSIELKPMEITYNNDLGGTKSDEILSSTKMDIDDNLSIEQPTEMDKDIIINPVIIPILNRAQRKKLRSQKKRKESKKLKLTIVNQVPMNPDQELLEKDKSPEISSTNSEKISEPNISEIPTPNLSFSEELNYEDAKKRWGAAFNFRIPEIDMYDLDGEQNKIIFFHMNNYSRLLSVLEPEKGFKHNFLQYGSEGFTAKRYNPDGTFFDYPKWENAEVPDIKEHFRKKCKERRWKERGYKKDRDKFKKK